MALEEESKVAYPTVGFQEATTGIEEVVEAC
jgi:hypothetical protein